MKKQDPEKLSYPQSSDRLLIEPQVLRPLLFLLHQTSFRCWHSETTPLIMKTSESQNTLNFTLILNLFCSLLKCASHFHFCKEILIMSSSPLFMEKWVLLGYDKTNSPHDLPLFTARGWPGLNPRRNCSPWRAICPWLHGTWKISECWVSGGLRLMDFKPLIS